MILRDYQQNAVIESVNFLRYNIQNQISDARLLWAAPTGSGKSLVELAILKAIPNSWIVTPRVEIIVGMLQKMGFDYIDRCSENEIMSLAFKHKIGTPIKLANRWMAGELECPSALILDESHHDNSDSWQNLHNMTLVPAVGFTATPYRGTPQETATLRRRWGTPRWMITYESAERQHYISMPYCMTEPLVDDDVIKIQGADFAIKSLNTESLNRVEDAARYIERFYDPIQRKWDRATLVAVPSSVVAESLESLLPMGGACVITADTSKRVRQEYFKATISRDTVLIHINTVTEGVDLPIRRLIDFSPTISPVRWVQQVGRIMRPTAPGEEPPVYICLNRNLLRHAYILAGALPNAAKVVKEALEAFGGYGKRPAGGRVFGTEGLGRIQGTEIKLLNGLQGLFYAFARTVDKQVQNFAVIFHPLQTHPIWACRTDHIVSEPVAQFVEGKVVPYQMSSREWGKWEKCEPLSDNIIGFSSLPNRPPTPKQVAWWQRSAEQFGLSPEIPNNKQFQILPVLKDLGIRIV